MCVCSTPAHSFRLAQILLPSPSKMTSVAPDFRDSHRWMIEDGCAYYKAQNTSYKEVLLGGTPIEWFVTGEVPVIPGPAVMPPNVRFVGPRASVVREYDATAAHDYIDEETHVIGSGDWVVLDCKAVQAMQWTYGRIRINGVPTELSSCDADGAIFEVLDREDENCYGTYLYVLQNTRRPQRLRILRSKGCVTAADLAGGLLRSTVVVHDVDGPGGLRYIYDDSGEVTVIKPTSVTMRRRRMYHPHWSEDLTDLWDAHGLTDEQYYHQYFFGQ